MVAVADDLRLHLLVLHSGGNDAGIPVVNAGHGVVQVGQVGHAGLHRRPGVVIVGIRVGNGHGAKLAGLFDEFHRAGKLRGDIHDPHQAAAVIKKLPEALEIRILQVVRVLSPPLFVGEIGSLHLNAHEPGQPLRSLLFELLGGGEGLFQHVVGQSHGGGGEGGHAAGGIVGRHFFEAFVVPVGEVRPGIAVAVHIDKAGNDGSAMKVNGIGGNFLRQDSAEPAVLNLKAAGDKPEIRGEDSGIFVEHRILLRLLVITVMVSWFPEKCNRPGHNRQRKKR